MVARTPRRYGGKPGSDPASVPSRSSSVYRGATGMPSGVSHVRVPGSAPFRSAAAACSHASRSGVSLMGQAYGLEVPGPEVALFAFEHVSLDFGGATVLADI